MVNAGKTIRTKAVSRCVACGSVGQLKHSALRDRLLDAPGQWNLEVCANKSCLTMWLNPMPLEEDIHIAYENYYTHSDVLVAGDVVRGAYAKMKAGYMAARYSFNASEKRESTS